MALSERISYEELHRGNQASYIPRVSLDLSILFPERPC